ncbi:MAG: HEAT repeat domain-containing protein [Candidatus Sericytochromatia bacterium]|nr:HEAT repeat domain-containing protein [Candidatus Sericytochromatia bacterium]
MEPWDALVRALASPGHREAAYRALVQSGAAAVPALARAAAVESDQSDPTYSARGVLSVLGSLAMPSLVAGLAVRERGQCQASAVLRAMGTAAVPHLRVALEHMDPLVREQAAVTLGLIPDVGPQALGELAERLGDPDARVCVAVAEALELHADLGFVPDWQRLMPLIVRTYAKADSRLRAALLRLLPSAEVRAAALLPHLLATVEEGREELRLPAVRVLAAIGPHAESALPMLERLNRHSTGPLRMAVEDAISALSGR